MADNDMTLDELIVLMAYKAKHIKAHLSLHTFECVCIALQQLQEFQYVQEKQNSDL